MEPEIFKVATKFAYEINKLESRKAGARLRLDIQVSIPYASETPKIELTAHFHDGSNYQDVKAASLGVLMDEVYRRLQFEDREALRFDEVQTRLVALPTSEPAPSSRHKELDDEIPF